MIRKKNTFTKKKITLIYSIGNLYKELDQSDERVESS